LGPGKAATLVGAGHWDNDQPALRWGRGKTKIRRKEKSENINLTKQGKERIS